MLQQLLLVVHMSYRVRAGIVLAVPVTAPHLIVMTQIAYKMPQSVIRSGIPCLLIIAFNYVSPNTPNQRPSICL